MSALLDLVAMVARLRGPDGCPWDRAQTLPTLRPYLLEESYEVLDALGEPGGPPSPALRGELGDLLFILVLIARVAEEEGAFSLEDAAAAVGAKMVRRHPHVFGPDAGAVEGGTNRSWEQSKAAERAATGDASSALDGVPAALPALLAAHRQGEKAAAVGFDWKDPRGVFAKVREELAELEEAVLASGGAADAAVHHEVGDLLLSVASVARHLAVPPEQALRAANTRFASRFREMERRAREAGTALGALDDAALDALWEQAKAELSPRRAERRA